MQGKPAKERDTIPTQSTYPNPHHHPQWFCTLFHITTLKTQAYKKNSLHLFPYQLQFQLP